MTFSKGDVDLSPCHLSLLVEPPQYPSSKQSGNHEIPGANTYKPTKHLYSTLRQAGTVNSYRCGQGFP